MPWCFFSAFFLSDSEGFNTASILKFVALFHAYTIAGTPFQLAIQVFYLYGPTYASTTQTINGYRYACVWYYKGVGVIHDVSISSGANVYLLTELPIGGNHNISIVAMSHLLCLLYLCIMSISSRKAVRLNVLLYT